MKADLANRYVATLKPQAKPYEVRDSKLKGLLLRVQPTGSMTYYCEYARGKRIKLGPADALATHEARELAKHTLADALKGEDPVEAKRKAKQHSLGTFILEEYQPWAMANVKTYKATVARLRFAFFDFWEMRLDELNAWQVEKWRNQRLNSGTKASTINRELTDLRSSLNKAIEWGLLVEHPLKGIKRSRVDDKGKVRYLSKEEEARLREALIQREKRQREQRNSANQWRAERNYPLLSAFTPFEYTDHLAPMVLLAINTGLRRGELFNLTWQNVDLGKQMLTVEGETAKSGSTRHVSLNNEAVSVLQRWQHTTKAGHGLVFPSDQGTRLEGIRKSCRVAQAG